MRKWVAIGAPGPLPQDKAAPASATADFGFTQVPVAEKASLVRGVFERVASRYDVITS